MNNRTLGTFRIDKAKWEAFQEKAREQGSNASSLLVGWIEAYLDGSIDSIDRSENRIDEGIDSLDLRIDNRIDNAVSHLQARLDKVEKELGEFAA